MFVGLVFGGASWLLSLSTLNASMQLSLPAWVRARGLSVYQLIFMGGQALGSLVWGVLAGATSSVDSLLVSAGLLVVCALSVAVVAAARQHRQPRPDAVVALAGAHADLRARTARRSGAGDDVLPRRSRRTRTAFLAAMAVMGRSRQRTGAARWRLYRSVERESTFVETFVVRSWGEHLHQHYTRLTGQDRVIEQAVEQFVDHEPVSQHLIAVRDVR